MKWKAANIDYHINKNKPGFQACGIKSADQPIWQPGNRGNVPDITVDPWICVPDFRQVYLYHGGRF